MTKDQWALYDNGLCTVCEEPTDNDGLCNDCEYEQQLAIEEANMAPTNPICDETGIGRVW